MLIGICWEQLPLLMKARKLGLKTVVTTRWKKEKINADRVIDVDSRDLVRLEQIFLEEKPDAVIADECDYSMYAVAYLADKYSLPGPGLYALTVTNNKYLQRKLIGETEVIQPDYQLCWNFDTIKEASKKFRFPLVVKPLDNRRSIGVSIARNKEELKDAWFTAISNSHSRICLAEVFIHGDIITFEGFHDSKNFHFLSISTKDSYEGTKIVAKKLYYPGKIYDHDFIKNIVEISNRIIKIIKLRFGFTHIEFIIEKDTKIPYFIEIANRGGVVHISNKILSEIIGIDLTEKLIQMALGENIIIDWDGNYKTKVLMYFINPSGKTPPNKIVEKYKERILAFFMKPGYLINKEKTKDALGRAGVVLLKGNNFEELHKIGDEIEKNVGSLNEEFYWGGNEY